MINERRMMSQKQPVQAIVFDLMGVVFFVNKMKALRCLGKKELFLYYLKKGKNPIDEGIMLLDRMRKEVPGQFQEVVAYKGTYLPNCFLEWNQGLITRKEAFGHLALYFETLTKEGYFSNENHKRVLLNLLQKVFSSELSLNSYVPIASTVKLIQKLKAMNRYKLYVLSNIDTETFEGMLVLHKPLFDLFDGIVTSCYSKFLKPDVAIFNYLFATHGLDPLTSCFIDDQVENIAAAQRLGMQTILCENPSKLSALMKKSGIL